MGVNLSIFSSLNQIGEIPHINYLQKAKSSFSPTSEAKNRSFTNCSATEAQILPILKSHSLCFSYLEVPLSSGQPCILVRRLKLATTHNRVQERKLPSEYTDRLRTHPACRIDTYPTACALTPSHSKCSFCWLGSLPSLSYTLASLSLI